MTPALAANLLAYSCQLALIAVVASIAAVVCRVRTPRLLLAHYQAALALGLILPPLASRIGPSGASTVLLGVVAIAPTAESASSPAPQVLTVAVTLLVAGSVARLCWLVLGFVRLGSYRRAARPFDEVPQALTDLERELRTRPLWLVSDAIEGAATYGLWPPVVLLPAQVVADAGPRLRMIACHELLHVRRRDWVAVIAEEFIRAVFWFHPAIWFLLDRIHLYREQAVDEQVVSSTGDRQAYASALLDGVPAGWSLPPSPASTWMPVRHLRARILFIVNGGSMSRTRVILSGVVFAIALTASGIVAVHAFPLQSTGQDERVYDTKEPGVTLPKVVRLRKPDYTQEAMDAHIEGSMTVSAVIRADGSVGEVKVARSLDPTFGLDQKGLDAAREASFQAGMKDGKPVAVRVEIEFRFLLK